MPLSRRRLLQGLLQAAAPTPPQRLAQAYLAALGQLQRLAVLATLVLPVLMHHQAAKTAQGQRQGPGQG